MRTASCLGWAAALLLLATSVEAADGWSRLRPGMTRGETMTVLGSPVLKTNGHGFELWLYDGGAEVVCYRGVVLGWTAPRASAPAPVQVAAAPSPVAATHPAP